MTRRWEFLINDVVKFSRGGLSHPDYAGSRRKQARRLLALLWDLARSCALSGGWRCVSFEVLHTANPMLWVTDKNDKPFICAEAGRADSTR